ncbi:MAG: cytochrome c family protein [Alphaproteobacteria bacterium]|nr:cytochrome c family protein [Alphaproteobacteria bacterium]
MMKLRLFGALIASAALAACGGGGEDSGDTSAADTSADSAVEQTAAAAEDTADTAVDAAEDTATDMADAASDAADDMAGAAEDAAENMAGAAQDAADEAMGADESAAGSEEGFTIAGLTGDPEAGRRVFARCRSCHVLEEGVNRVGPSLYGIFGRETGSVEGFRYSDANASAGITWTGETMFEYLENPREYIPGTIMAFPGLRSEQDRADVIAYIKANGGLGDEG